MRKETPILLAALAIVTSYGCGRALAQTGGEASPGNQRESVELLVYSNDFGMVREVRKVELNAGKTLVGLQGVSKSLDQSSVLFHWPSNKTNAEVVSSTYDMGMDNAQHLLKRLLGKEIELVFRGDNGKEGERIKGTLEVAEPGNVVVKANGRYIVNPAATIEAPIENGIVTIPQLTAEVDSKTGGKTDLAVTYMTGGLSWTADYTATLSPNSDEMALECWATVTNQTGTDFPNAKVSFVAGSPNRLLRRQPLSGEDRANGSADFSAVPASAKAFAEPQSFGELYAYPYKASASIRQDQMNRVRMMGNEKVSVRKYYSVAIPYMGRDYSAFPGNPEQRFSATLGLNFTNAAKDGLGLPLPSGGVRLFEPDGKGGVRFIGAASIGNTPKDARVNFTLTDVFDVYARGRMLGIQKVDKKHTNKSVEITVNNEKSQAVEVRLVQSFGNRWKIASETEKGQKLNASSNQWTLKVPAGGEAKLRYTVTLGD